MAANELNSAGVIWDAPLSRKRRDTSMRLTLSRPQDWQMEAALAAHAVEKLRRGPTCHRHASL